MLGISSVKMQCDMIVISSAKKQQCDMLVNSSAKQQCDSVGEGDGVGGFSSVKWTTSEIENSIVQYQGIFFRDPLIQNWGCNHSWSFASFSAVLVICNRNLTGPFRKQRRSGKNSKGRRHGPNMVQRTFLAHEKRLLNCTIVQWLEEFLAEKTNMLLNYSFIFGVTVCTICFLKKQIFTWHRGHRGRRVSMSMMLKEDNMYPVSPEDAFS